MASPPNITVPLAGLVSSLFALGAPGRASAEPPDLRQTEVHVLQERAQRAMETDELDEARVALLALKSIEPSVNTTCNLGLVERRLGLFVEAVESLTQCVRAYTLVPVGLEEQERVDELNGELAMAKAEVATVVVRAPSGAKISIDQSSTPAASLERGHYVAPGWHTIEVGRERRRVELKRGTTTTLRFEPPREEPRAMDPVVVIGLVSTGVSGIAGGVLLGSSFAVSSAADKEWEAAAAAGGCRSALAAFEECSSWKSSRDTASSLLSAGVLSLAVAGALGIGTLIYRSQRPSARRVAVGVSSVKAVFVW